MGICSSRSIRKAKQVSLPVTCPELTTTDKWLIQQHWALLTKKHTDFAVKVLKKVFDHSAIIHTIFGFDTNDDAPQADPRFVHISNTVGQFFNSLIVKSDLDFKAVQDQCMALGGRHVQYSDRGFKSVFWDIFMLCLAESVKENIMIESGVNRPEEHKEAVICAWHKLITLVVKSMKSGYRRQLWQPEMRHDNKRTETESDVDVSDCILLTT